MYNEESVRCVCVRNILKVDRNIYKGAKFEFLIFCRSHRVLSDAKGAMRK